ncbi:hypothetical protein B0G52_1101 [Cohnella sp. SGD-V74]|nr:hypothetical protein B0G52_1101 [Cohnella sp. SGD-V74]
MTFVHPRCAMRYFNPRIPRGMRLALRVEILELRSISIHASREGCDLISSLPSPLGDRFQSTHPARDATVDQCINTARVMISIHASREGCDVNLRNISVNYVYFNPRIPRGMRLRRHVCSPIACYFNPRIPRGMRLSQSSALTRYSDFNPRIPRGMRRSPRRSARGMVHFNPRIPRGMRPMGSSLVADTTLFQSTHPARDATRRLQNGRRDG